MERCSSTRYSGVFQATYACRACGGSSPCRVKLGKSPLGLANLVWLGIVSAIHGTQSFACILTTTLSSWKQEQSAANLRRVKGRANSGLERSEASTIRARRPDGGQRSAFAKARQRMPMTFWLELIIVLGEHFEKQRGPEQHFRGFRVLPWTARGSTCRSARACAITLHRQECLRRQQRRLGWCVAVSFTRMPYRYELSPVSCGEVTMAVRLCPHLRPHDLVLLDAASGAMDCCGRSRSRRPVLPCV